MLSWSPVQKSPSRCVCLIVCAIGTSTMRQLRLHLGCLTTETRCERYFVLVLWTYYQKGKRGKFSVGYNTSTHYPWLNATSTHNDVYWNMAVTSNQTRNVYSFFVPVDTSLFLRSCQWQVILIYVKDYLNSFAICRMRMQNTHTIHRQKIPHILHTIISASGKIWLRGRGKNDSEKKNMRNARRT